MSGADATAGSTFVNEDGEWEGLPSVSEPEPEPATLGRQEKSFASLEEAAKAAEAAGVTDAVMMGIDMACHGNLMKNILGLGESAPTGKLSSTQRTAKQKAKLQRGLLREATQSAQTMNKINAAARAQLRPGSLTAPRACAELPACTPARFPLVLLLCSARPSASQKRNGASTHLRGTATPSVSTHLVSRCGLRLACSAAGIAPGAY